MKWLLPFFLLSFGVVNALLAPMGGFHTFVVSGKMPEPVSNNAVTYYNGQYYSFGGIDSTKVWSGIHGKVFKVYPDSFTTSSLGNWPDSIGKIGVASSLVKDKIYVIGGYSVDAMGGEISHSNVHIFDPATDTFLADGMPIPLPIDDHVQAVYKDSLIYVVTGWSNTGHVPNVQIYNPALNNWTVGTPVPNNNDYLAFGAYGIIRKNYIYYFGGAAPGLNFPLSNKIRIGKIDTINPTNISWSDTTLADLNGRYRAGITLFGISSLNLISRDVMIIGGSAATYNYNGLSYATNTPTWPIESQFLSLEGSFVGLLGNSYAWRPFQVQEDEVMDLRFQCSQPLGLFDLNVLGGMKANAKVLSDIKDVKFFPTNVEEVSTAYLPYKLFYHASHVAVKSEMPLDYEVFTITGQKLLQKENATEIKLDFNIYATGTYLVSMSNGKLTQSTKIIIP